MIERATERSAEGKQMFFAQSFPSNVESPVDTEGVCFHVYARC